MFVIIVGWVNTVAGQDVTMQGKVLAFVTVQQSTQRMTQDYLDAVGPGSLLRKTCQLGDAIPECKTPCTSKHV